MASDASAVQADGDGFQVGGDVDEPADRLRDGRSNRWIPSGCSSPSGAGPARRIRYTGRTGGSASIAALSWPSRSTGRAPVRRTSRAVGHGQPARELGVEVLRRGESSSRQEGRLRGTGWPAPPRPCSPDRRVWPARSGWPGHRRTPRRRRRSCSAARCRTRCPTSAFEERHRPSRPDQLPHPGQQIPGHPRRDHTGR